MMSAPTMSAPNVPAPPAAGKLTPTPPSQPPSARLIEIGRQARRDHESAQQLSQAIPKIAPSPWTARITQPQPNLQLAGSADIMMGDADWQEWREWQEYKRARAATDAAQQGQEGVQQNGWQQEQQQAAVTRSQEEEIKANLIQRLPPSEQAAWTEVRFSPMTPNQQDAPASACVEQVTPAAVPKSAGTAYQHQPWVQHGPKYGYQPDTPPVGPVRVGSVHQTSTSAGQYQQASQCQQAAEQWQASQYPQDAAAGQSLQASQYPQATAAGQYLQASGSSHQQTAGAGAAAASGQHQPAVVQQSGCNSPTEPAESEVGCLPPWRHAQKAQFESKGKELLAHGADLIVKGLELMQRAEEIK